MKLRPILLVSGLFLTGLVSYFFWQNASTDGGSAVILVKPPGSLRSLTTWPEARDYPYEVGADNRYFRAWQKTTRFRKAAIKGKDNLGWSPLGPQNLGGRTLVLAIDPVNPDRMFAGSASGGLWRSETAGVGERAWSRVATGFPILGVGAIAINPLDNRQIYIGTGEVCMAIARPGRGLGVGSPVAAMGWAF